VHFQELRFGGVFALSQQMAYTAVVALPPPLPAATRRRRRSPPLMQQLSLSNTAVSACARLSFLNVDVDGKLLSSPDERDTLHAPTLTHSGLQMAKGACAAVRAARAGPSGAACAPTAMRAQRRPGSKAVVHMQCCLCALPRAAAAGADGTRGGCGEPGWTGGGLVCETMRHVRVGCARAKL